MLPPWYQRLVLMAGVPFWGGVFIIYGAVRLAQRLGPRSRSGARTPAPMPVGLGVPVNAHARRCRRGTRRHLSRWPRPLPCRSIASPGATADQEAGCRCAGGGSWLAVVAHLSVVVGAQSVVELSDPWSFLPT
jgi:hypothetical protein